MQARSFLRPTPPAAARDALAATALALPADFPERAAEAAELLKALANPDRLLLLCQLVGGEKAVTELGVLTNIEQPSLSQQLAVLRGERLVATRREGKNMFYSIASPAALAVLETLYRLFCSAPAAGDSKQPTATPTGRVMRPRKDIE